MNKILIRLKADSKKQFITTMSGYTILKDKWTIVEDSDIEISRIIMNRNDIDIEDIREGEDVVEGKIIDNTIIKDKPIKNPFFRTREEVEKVEEIKEEVEKVKEEVEKVKEEVEKVEEVKEEAEEVKEEIKEDAEENSKLEEKKKRKYNKKAIIINNDVINE